VIRAIFLIARKEIFTSLHSMRFIFTMDLICLFFLAAAFMMFSDSRMRRQAYEAKAKSHASDIAALMADPDPRQQFRILFWEGGLGSGLWTACSREPLGVRRANEVGSG
jgi:hypothetical protein